MAEFNEPPPSSRCKLLEMGSLGPLCAVLCLVIFSDKSVEYQF